MDRYIYKILPESLWQDAVSKGEFAGAGIDLKDGYIHFSTAAQAQETARLHFTNQTGLILVEVDCTELEIIWEPSRGGQLFPHLYDKLPLHHVTNSWPLPLGNDGLHSFPEAVTGESALS